MTAAFIVDAVRTPVGKIGGALAGVRPDDLAADTLRSLLSRHASLDPAAVEGVVLGNANGAGEENRNVGRMATLLAGLPVSVPGSTVNRLCGSGLEAVVQASREVEVGDADVIVAGGVESMSRAPWVVLKPDRPYPRDHSTMYSTTLGWRMVNPAFPPEWTVALGLGAEIMASEFSISRQAQDEFAVSSHQRAAAAWREGIFDAEVVAVASTSLTTDESVRADSSVENLAKLKPAFQSEGSVTAGNSSPMNDGASALLLMSEVGLAEHDCSPMARIASRAVSGVEPQRYGIGPVVAAQIALKRAGIGWSDLSVVELNEAFAAQALACLRSWRDLDPTIVNPHGGAIALGHPVGASGARILTSLAHELRRVGGGWGLATMCIGVGQGIAVVIDAR
ncbi:MAG TPA: thiolase family protein [Acidimicrobiales bacterium]